VLADEAASEHKPFGGKASEPSRMRQRLGGRCRDGRIRNSVGSGILFSVDAWDANCPRHVPRRLEADAVYVALEERDRRIAELEAEIAAFKARVDPGAQMMT
jgi:hypothetical protein